MTARLGCRRPGRLASAPVLLGVIAGLLGASCSNGISPTVYVFDDPQLQGLQPGTLLPGSRLALAGKNFVPEDIGQTRVRLRGTFAGQSVDVSLPARFVDYTHAEADFGGGVAAGLPADEGAFDGEATVEIDNVVDGLTHASPPLSLSLDLRAALTPRLDLVSTGPIFVNDLVPVEGDGFLLGDDEGETVAVVSGCYRETGQPSCTAVGPVEVTVTPETPGSRTRGTFPFDPYIAGIKPGTFENGVVKLRNQHGVAAGQVVRESGTLNATWDVLPATIFSVAPAQASLGQYVDIAGAGFVGVPAGISDPTVVTTFELRGTFTPDGGGGGTSVALTIIGEWVSGRLVRYVLNEQDELGRTANLREVAGAFSGTIKPVVMFKTQTVAGDEVAIAFAIGRVRQIIWLNFQTSYVESLRHFGLRAVDQPIRARVLAVSQRDYAGLNVEFRMERPTDFALYSEVDIQGPDPNRLGLLGYDNTPGKDVDNVRLYDKIGGENALTREDGYPGYGGVFVESFFGFSEHPGAFATKLDGAVADFDQLFDPFRPDRGGQPVTATELAGGAVPTLSSGSACPPTAGGRPLQIACAMFALGSMIGTTMTHEVGHSLGLADPYGGDFHNPGDLPNRLMDAGGARSFNERAEIFGEGPAVFCEEEFQYLRQILPSTEEPPGVTRPPCY
ncbi:MAG: hypothetical protein HY906_02550 [Deltaproteobacteria bacterium]|nr:hypothetical protein [Deltaproteobacteria bacterium]